MGFLSKLFGLESSDEDENQGKISQVDYIPTISKGASIVRGIDTVSFVFKNHKKFQGAIILIWQPKRHSFTQYTWSEKQRRNDTIENNGIWANEDVTCDNGDYSYDAGAFRHRFVDGTDEVIFDWTPDKNYALENHNVKLTAIIDGEFITKTGEISILNAPITLDRKENNEKEVLIENLKSKVQESTTTPNV
jgi:hypothetical protein